MHKKLLMALCIVSLTGLTGQLYAQTKTTVPISAELGTSMATSQFPMGAKLETVNLLLTQPKVIFLNAKRLAMQVQLQAYDHRPEAGVAISEKGSAMISGELDYDPATREVVLHAPRIDQLAFDRDNTVTQRLLIELNQAWNQQVADPLRTELPQHPFLLPFRDYIQDVSYDGVSISLVFSYDAYQPQAQTISPQAE